MAQTDTVVNRSRGRGVSQGRVEGQRPHIQSQKSCRTRMGRLATRRASGALRISKTEGVLALF